MNHVVPVKVLIPVIVGLMTTSAEAQVFPTWETHITLTQQDLDMIRNTVTNEVHGKPVGTKASWSNPASGNSGSIRFDNKLVLRGQQCENIAYTVRSKGPPVYTEHYHFTSCLQPGKSPEPSANRDYSPVIACIVRYCATLCHYYLSCHART